MAKNSSQNYSIEDSSGPNSVNKNENEVKEYVFEDALSVIGFGKVQIAILLVCGLILMAVIDETMGMMIIVIGSQCDLNLGDKEKGFLGAVSFLGILISSHLWGYLADTIGRRKIMVYTLFGSNILAICSCFTNNYWIFVGVRLLAGICISGPSATLYAYLGEFNTVKNRPVTISTASIFVGIATVFIPGIAWVILPQTWSFQIYEGLSFRPWKLLLIIYSSPGFIGALCLYNLPESPKFLLSQGREREAFNIVEWIYRKNTGKIASENFIVKKLLIECNKEYMENLTTKKNCKEVIKSMWHQTIPLFMKPYVTNFLICCIVQFGLFFCSAGMGLWYPEIQNRISAMEANQPMTVCSVIHFSSNKEISSNTTHISNQVPNCNDDVNPQVFINSMTLGVFYIIGYMILAIIINPLGRGIILAVALFGSGLSGLALHWITNPLAIVILFCSFLMLAGLCVSVVNGAVVDLIPTHLRGMAVCIALMMGRLGSIVGSNFVGFLLEINCNITFFFFSGFITMCGILTFFLPS